MAYFLKKIWANSGPFFVHFRPFLIPMSTTISTNPNFKNRDGVLGIWIRGQTIVPGCRQNYGYMAATPPPVEFFYSRQGRFGPLSYLLTPVDGTHV